MKDTDHREEPMPATRTTTEPDGAVGSTRNVIALVMHGDPDPIDIRHLPVGTTVAATARLAVELNVAFTRAGFEISAIWLTDAAAEKWYGLRGMRPVTP